MKPVLICIILSLLVGLCIPAPAGAQDSLALLRRFVQVSDLYKDGDALYAAVAIRHGAAYKAEGSDTISSEMKFYLTEQGAYLQSGQVEEVIGDSLLLLVNKAAHRMLLAHSNQPVKQRLQSFMGIVNGQASLEELSRKFSVQALPSDNGEAGLELDSRAMAFGTMLPKEIIRLQYNAKTGRPAVITQTRRTLVLLDSSEYAALQQQEVYQGRLLATGHNRYFLVNEHTITFTYQAIVTGKEVHLPVRLADRIRKNEQGEYVPAAGYETFLLSKQP